jgi:hypothetical protein
MPLSPFPISLSWDSLKDMQEFIRRKWGGQLTLRGSCMGTWRVRVAERGTKKAEREL